MVAEAGIGDAALIGFGDGIVFDKCLNRVCLIHVHLSFVFHFSLRSIHERVVLYVLYHEILPPFMGSLIDKAASGNLP